MTLLTYLWRNFFRIYFAKKNTKELSFATRILQVSLAEQHMMDQCAQWLLEFFLGAHRIPLRGHCNLIEVNGGSAALYKRGAAFQLIFLNKFVYRSCSQSNLLHYFRVQLLTVFNYSPRHYISALYFAKVLTIYIILICFFFS